MKKILLVLSVCALSQPVWSQHKSIRFSSLLQFGVVKGASDETFQLQAINGVQYKSWFAGVGIGIDDYYHKSVPLFVDIRKHLFSGNQTPFLYADFGANLPWKKEEADSWQISRYQKGIFYEAGVGYSMPVKGRVSVCFSAGYAQKSFHETRTANGVIWDFPPYGRDATETFDYTFRRLSFKMGLRF